VNPSTSDSGSSSSPVNSGISGTYSTIACTAAYSNGPAPAVINEGGIPKNGALIQVRRKLAQNIMGRQLTCDGFAAIHHQKCGSQCFHE